MRGVGARMREPLGTVGTFKGLLSRVDPNVFLEMVFEFECFTTFWAFELSKDLRILG